MAKAAALRRSRVRAARKVAGDGPGARRGERRRTRRAPARGVRRERAGTPGPAALAAPV